MATGYFWKEPTPKQPNTAVKTPAPSNPFSQSAVQSEAAKTGGETQNVFSGFVGDKKPGGSIMTQLAGSPSVFNPQLAQQGKNTISQMLTSTGESPADQYARSQYIKAQDEAARKLQEQSALSGRVDSGQIQGDSRGIMNQLLAGRGELESQLAIGQSDRQRQDQATGISALLQASGQHSQNQQAAASLGLQQEALQLEEQGLAQAKELAQQGFSLEESAQQLQKYGLDQNTATRLAELASSEKIAYSGLSLDREKMELANQVSLMGMNLEKSAQALTARGMDQEDARFYASLAQTKELENKGFSLQEKQLALTEKGMSQDDARFYAGLSHDKEMEGIKQKFQRGERLETQEFSAYQDHLDRKWKTGERMGAEDFALAKEFREMAHQENMAMLTSKLGVDAQRQIDTWRNDYDTKRLDKTMSHEAAMEQFKSEKAAELQASGYDRQEALQIAELTARSVENDRNRTMQSAIEFAKIAQNDQQFAAQMGIDEQKLAQNKMLVEAQVEEMRASTDIKLSALEMEKLRMPMETAAMLMSLPGIADSPDMIEQANLLITQGMRDSGMITGEQYEMGLLSTKASGFDHPGQFIEWAESNGYDGKAAAAVANEVWPGGKAKEQVKVDTDTQTGVTTAQFGDQDMRQSGDHWKAAMSQPKAIEQLIGSGVIQESTTKLDPKRISDLSSWLSKNGIQGSYKTWDDHDDTHLQFEKGQEPIVMLNSQPVMITRGISWKEGDSGFFGMGGGKRHTEVWGIDMKTGKEVKLSDRVFDP
jgi:hypothetical protein